MPARKRRRTSYINVRLSPVADPDLIAWWEGLPEGTGGDTVKRAIRAYIANTTDTQEATRADLDTASQWVVTQVADAQTAQTTAITRAIAALNTQLQSMQRQLSSGVIVASGQSATPDEPPALSQEEQQKRIKKVVAQKW